MGGGKEELHATLLKALVELKKVALQNGLDFMALVKEAAVGGGAPSAPPPSAPNGPA